MAPTEASGGPPLPIYVEMFTAFPDLLFIFELVFGGLVWILIVSSLVPLPLFQGWVMFASVFCFIGTGVLFFSYIFGDHYEKTSFVTLEAAYHCIATVFYLSSSILEAMAAISMHNVFTRERYLENVFATVFSALATLLYMNHAWFSVIRWKCFSLRSRRNLPENPENIE